MSGPIQTIPQGLLGLLQLKQTGINPRELLETVQPTVEMFPLWIQRLSVDLSQQLFGGNGSIAIATASPGATFFTTNPHTVSNFQAVYVESFLISCNLLAAETIIVAPAVLYQSLGIQHVLVPPERDTVTARARQLRVVARNFWLPPASALGFFVFDDLTAGTITVTGNLRGVAVPV